MYLVPWAYTFDSQLKWNKQVNMVAKSYSAKLSQLKRLRYLPKSVLEKIYYQSIVAGVVYCMPVWGTCSPSQFNELELIHERAARIIFNLPKNVNVLQKQIGDPWNTSTRSEWQL